MKKLDVLVVTIALCYSVPALAAPITEEVLSFETRDGLTLDGYLTYPGEIQGPFPAVLLIAGSGLQDADVTVSGGYGMKGIQKIYKGLAHDFSRQGFIVFRYNKRGASFEHANDNPNLLLEADHRDLLEDARNAMRALVDHPLTSASSLTVVGNSEGVLLALQLGVTHREIDLLILIGSPAYGFKKSMRYYSVDRSVDFARLAADANQDGSLTLAELDRLDGKHGRGSIHILTMETLLFELEEGPDGSREVVGFSSEVDLDQNGRVEIETELEPALRARMNRGVARWRSGEEGRYFQSFYENKPPLKYVHRVHGNILFAQGELDIVTHFSECLALIEKRDRFEKPWDAILFPKLGHTLSKSRNYFQGDDGLTLLDNPTQNAPQKKARREIIRRAKEMLELVD